MNDDTPSRRSILAAIGAVGVGGAGVVLGSAAVDRTDGAEPSREPGPTAPSTTDRTQRGQRTSRPTESGATTTAESGPPVVDSGAGDPDRRITVDVRVVDGDGRAVAGEPVLLQDRGGTPDARFGRTGPEGRLRFVEGVGPSPCNRQLLALPARDRRVGLGCNDGGAELEHTFQVEGPTPELPTGEGEGPPVVGTGSDDPDWNLTVDVRVIGPGGEPLADEPVVLQDRGGTPDGRFGLTDARGRLRFVENVGPPPCNRQLLVLPARDRRASLGCNDGGETVEHTFRLDGEDSTRDGDDDGGDGDGRPPLPAASTPVVENAADDPSRNLTVDLRVIDGDGRPVEGEPVVLQDRGGTPDDRIGYTGPMGWVRFVESVGPPPCNRQTVLLPARDQRTSLGCNDGGKALAEVVRVQGERTEPGRRCRTDADSRN